ncbi:uncharacterized protein LOC132798412 [Drosophila nasuta]|uniref:uncharacterized protein LOC132798412 n=1 Tax=Drosophila nasuta TaxID=42062 RepID=UPI00295E3DA8|nr:uncharacterized protein LOC132798412 [Drosophila nasuta]
MRCILLLVLTLSLASTAPTRNNLKDDLRKAIEEPYLLLRRQNVWAGIQISQKVIDTQRIKQEYIASWQTFHDKLTYVNETWAENGPKLGYVLNEVIGLQPTTRSRIDMNYYTNGAFDVIESKNLELKTPIFAEFETKAKEIIRVYREAGYTNKDIDLYFNNFVQNPNENFDELLRYLYDDL